MKLRSSTKIAVGFVLVVAAGWYGYKYATDRMVLNTNFSMLKPGTVNLVGIDTGRAYRVQVSNSIAQLVEANESEFEEDRDSSGGGPTEGANAKRVPVDDMLGAMQGNVSALGNLIAVMNEKTENENWPARRVIWKAEDLRKAIAGDATLRARLVKDLNVNLDGTPLDVIRVNSVMDGIVVDVPVPVRLNVGDKPTTLNARIQVPYRPRFCQSVTAQFESKQITSDMVQGYYVAEAKRQQQESSLREDVVRSLETIIDDQALKRLAEAPERILSRAQVVVNDSLIRGASYTEVDGPQGKKLYDMTIELTDEGRRRLWKYSKLMKPGESQLLLTVEGIPIAAPRVAHELAMSELTIKQLPDETLVKDAVDTINKARAH